MTKTVPKIIKGYKNIHGIACNLLQTNVPYPSFQPSNDPIVGMCTEKRKISINEPKMRKDFFNFRSDFQDYKSTFEEFVVYTFEEEDIHYTHLFSNPVIDNFGLILELSMLKNYLEGKIQRGDSLWSSYTLWKGYLEGIGKRGRKFIRDAIDFPRKDFDSKYESMISSNQKDQWKVLQANIHLPYPEIHAEAFNVISFALSEFFGRKIATDMEGWSIDRFRDFAKKSKFEFTKSDYELLESVKEQLEYRDFNDIFPVLRKSLIEQTKKEMSSKS